MKIFRARPGFTLAETLVTMVIMGIVGIAITRLMVSQSQFFNSQSSLINARSVSRGATSIMLSELRMVDDSGGVLAASRDSITVLVPYRMGVVCTNGGTTLVSFLPVDSSVSANATLSGYAWRDSTSGAWSYTTSGTTTGSGTIANCTTAGITTLTGGTALALAPALPTAAVLGTPVMLVQKITYRFGNSTSMSGSRALFRRVVDANTEEELVVPFDTAAKFRYFVLDSPTAQDAAPSPLSNMRGVELVLTARNERSSNTAPSTSEYTTAVWFKNRVN